MRIAFYGNFSVDYCSEVHHAKSLEQLGHQVIRLQEPKCTADEIHAAATSSDVFIWVHTHGWDTPGMDRVLCDLRERRIPTLTYHLDLWMGLQRQQDMQRDAYWQIEHFFTVDRLMADYLNSNTPVQGHYINAGVFGPECYLAEPTSPLGNDVVFVGQRNYHPEWQYRPQLVDWLQDSYGERFTRIAGDMPSGTIRGDDLNRLYASSKIAVGDSLCLNFDYPDYWSDRVYETLGRGGFLIHPRIAGMERTFVDEQHLVFYDFGDFDQLRFLIDYYLDNEAERETIRRAGHELVKSSQTYAHRWEQILAAL